MNRRLKKASAVLLAMTMLFSLAGCVDQSQGKKSSDSGTKTESSADTSSESAESLLKITDPKEKAAVEAAKKKVQELDGEPRLLRQPQISVTSWNWIWWVYAAVPYPPSRTDIRM